MSHELRDRKARYRVLCENEPTIPLFSRAWWLDAVCGDSSWDVALAGQDRNGQIMGSMPYCVRSRFGFRISSQPQLTQTLGPWIRPSPAKYAVQLGHQKDIMEELILQLPEFDYFSQYWHHSQRNWLPFFWHGYSQTTAYTYILSSLNDEPRLWSGLQPKIRTDIKKARDRYSLRVRDDLDIGVLWGLNEKTYKRQGLPMPYSEAFVREIDNECRKRGCSKLLIAEDPDGSYHAGVYIAWDSMSAYYLIGAGDPALRSSGAASLCIWEALRASSRVTETFDFEGSMVEPIERFFRGFGAVQTPYSRITKIPSRLMRLRAAYSQLIGK